MGQIQPTYVAAVLAGGYLLGSIPFGVIATRLGGAGDLRTVGSGNIGATNVLRTGRRDLALITLVGDGGKGAAAALIAYFWALRTGAFAQPQVAAALAAGAAFTGHLFPVWLRFKGGKGVATFFGALLAVAWPVGMMAGATWIAMAVLFRISSLASLTAAALAPLFAFALHAGYPVIALSVFMAVLIFFRHRQNIARLLRGQEPRIGESKTPAAPE
ncbi:MAG: glycerol-3-phosphate 1-O-acyltransferase PlsY [Caulobacteraceae bacterium]|nr:glycerol-3-phosphate 1-O-acyltransferase PlsY [Caulobacteraceae bacterium]